jgi:hypothetical protein
MTENDDPLRRATAGGDPACPDGEALAALGRIVRESSKAPRPADLVEGVLARLDSTDNFDADADADAIDAVYDRIGAQDPALLRLGDLVRGACALQQPVDLAEAVHKRLLRPSQLLPEATLDAGSRWRIWSAVIAAHAAALIAFSVYHFDFSRNDTPGDDQIVHRRDDAQLPGLGTKSIDAKPSSPLPQRLPEHWTGIEAMQGDLFVLRRTATSRVFARERFGMLSSAERVGEGLAWLCAQQQSDGSFGASSGNRDRDLAVQSLAALALLGEGIDDGKRIDVVRRALAWICQQRNAYNSFSDYQPVTAGMAALALTEGSVLLDDIDFRFAAQAAIEGLGTPLRPGAAGVGGFALLAVETAHACGLEVSQRMLDEARLGFGRYAATEQDSLANFGLAAFCESIYGQNDLAAAQGERLTSATPILDANGRAEPLNWLFPSLALREQGGEAWKHWSSELEKLLLPCFASLEGKSWVPAMKVAYADSDVFATSLVILNLQVPYRYLPMASSK